MLALFCSRITETERKIYPPSFSMTLVVEYQYRVYKIGSILGKKWPGLKENVVFFEMEECRAEKLGQFFKK